MSVSVQDTNPSERTVTRAELARKVIHLLVLLAPLTILYLGRDVSLFALVPLTAIAIICDILRARSATFRSVIDRLFGFMMRSSEWTPLGGPVILNGATWVLISLTFLIAVFPLYLAVASFSIFVVSDAVAALIGLSLGKHRWPGTAKTWEGSTAFFVVGLALALFLFKLEPVAATIAVIAGAIVEARLTILNDNFTAPVTISVVIWLLSTIL